jgi:2',3'-cyclic-nucleotide 2'-phosphodiesterase (5'-nucleotidase family)
MKRTALAFCLLLLAVALSGCTMSASPPAEATRQLPPTRTAGSLRASSPAPAPPETTPSAQPEATRVATPAPPLADTPGEPVTITIFYTNDEHGWMEGMEPDLGASSLLAHWQAAGYDPEGPFLALSGGDMWTGPAISTWFEGEGMVEVMNSMGYDAAAVGNHEFDFGLDALRARALESNFPLVSANLRTTEGDLPAEWGIEPYTIVDVAGVQVGILGLTTQRTRTTTNPANITGFDFIDYEDALREMAPAARAEGAELLLVAAHLCEDELIPLAQKVGDLGIALIGGGHCNERFAQEVNGIVLVEGGYHFTSYATVTLAFDPVGDEVLDASYEVALHEPAAEPDPEVSAVVARWRERVDAELEVVLGYSDQGLPRDSEQLRRLVPAAWLAAYPQADVALTNPGGFRAGIPAGPLTFADVVGVLPFNNVLVDVALSGDELEQLLSFRDAELAGVHRESFRWQLDNGEPIDPDATYHLLTTDFLYAGGDGYEMLARFDPEAYNTAIDWRQPLVDWVLAQESDENRPLEAAITELVGP